MDKVLIIGGSGMIGKHLSSYLSEFFEITIFDKNKTTNFETVELDVLDKDKFKKELDKRSFKAVVHLVGSRSITDAEKNPEEAIRLSLRSLQNLIYSCVGKDTKVIFLSSASVYGKESICKENSDPCPVNLYGVMKYLCEKVLEESSRKEGIRFTILRAFSIYTKDEGELLTARLFGARNSEEEVPLKNLNQKRDFVTIEDVCRAIKSAIETTESDGQTINVGSGKPYKLKKIVDLFKSKFHLNLRYLGEDGSGHDNVADISKMKKILKIKPEDFLSRLKEDLQK